jgi:hypothetical protein
MDSFLNSLELAMRDIPEKHFKISVKTKKNGPAHPWNCIPILEAPE